MGRVILIPWHIGDRLDLTFNAVKQARRLRRLLVEDPEDARRALAELMPGGAEGKTLFKLPEREDAAVLALALEWLETEDVGLMSSGGAPCFVDPGAWLVAAARKRGVTVVTLAGASVLTAVLSASGLEFLGRPDVAGVLFYAPQYSRGTRTFRQALEGHGPAQASVVLLRAGDAQACFSEMLPVVGGRAVSAFFDLTKDPARFPLAGAVLTRSCADWLRGPRDVDWARVSDLALLVHPAEAGR